MLERWPFDVCFGDSCHFCHRSPLHNYAIYSDDGGDNWTLSTNAATTAGDEAKVVELEDGDILMSIRNPSKGNRIFVNPPTGADLGQSLFRD